MASFATRTNPIATSSTLISDVLLWDRVVPLALTWEGKQNKELEPNIYIKEEEVYFEYQFNGPIFKIYFHFSSSGVVQLIYQKTL